MKASELLLQLEHMGIDTIAGVPDSTLKQFCDGVQTYKGKMSHYVTANEGAAVGVAIGSYLATGRPACVYMQNSGIGNASRASRTNHSMCFRERLPASCLRRLPFPVA